MNDPGKLRTSASNNACVKRKQKGLLITVKRIKFSEVVKTQGIFYKRKKILMINKNYSSNIRVL